MPAKKYIVELSDEERAELHELTSKGKQAARKMKRAQILLKSDEGWKDKEIIKALNTSRSTVERARKRFVEGGLEKALNEDPRPGAKRKLDGRDEAHLIALVCSEPPEDHDHWALRLLADKLVELGVVKTISHETVRQYLKKQVEALAAADVVHSRGQRRIRRRDGAHS
jgi:transposase